MTDYPEIAARFARETAALPVPAGSEPLTVERLAEIGALLRAVTPGQWLANDRIGVVTDAAGEPLAVFGGGEQDRADAAFTAAAPAVIAELLREVAYQRYWSKVGWDKANAYNELWVRDDARLTQERRLVARLREELSRQAKARDVEISPNTAATS